MEIITITVHMSFYICFVQKMILIKLGFKENMEIMAHKFLKN
jgi:hypothetical protein